MSVKICGVDIASPAHKKGISPGDILYTVNGHPIEDVLDYRFYTNDTRLLLELSSPEGYPYRVSLRKQEYAEAGLRFECYLMDSQRFCRNKCVFCFVDQLPPGLRETLYFKDDDSRMSFLFGNYVTLTNLQDRDIRRILKMRISPIHISVHTTNPDLRVKMMANSKAGDVLRYLPMLTDAGIKVNAQIVLVPDYNDKQELHRTLSDLCALSPGLQSLAVVPVGLTRFRSGLADLRLFTPKEATAVIDMIERFGQDMLRRHGERICYPADEFFLCADRPLPPVRYYGELAQLENGVGLLPLLLHEFSQALRLCAPRPLNRRASIATGCAAAPYITRMAKKAESLFPGLRLEVRAIANRFFGETITVAGLVTGADLKEQLCGAELGEELLLPRSMLRHEGDLFLDGVSRDELQAALKLPVRMVENDGFALLDAMTGLG